MKGKLSSSKQMENVKVSNANEESRLSGAYIRRLVKHLTSKDPLDGDNENVTENGECFNDVNNSQNKQRSQQQQQQQQPQQQQQQQHKKQVRRRLHTSRPYQERLLNMAEARREIVTALKFHRASMKQQESVANNLDHHQSSHEKKQKSRKVNSLYPSTATTTTTTVTNSYSSLSCPPLSQPQPVPYWPISTFVPPPPLSCHDNQDFVLPSQTLGLNLNFQNFSNLDTNLYRKPMSMYSASSTSSTPSTSSVPPKEAVSNSSGGLHHAMDDEEMEEIRSLGEQHQTEWNDTVNLVTSARWCNFLKTIEIETDDQGDEYNGFQRFDQAMEFPSWLINSNESSCLEQNFDDHFSDAYFQDPVLPCMDIGEIEAMDGEWLALKKIDFF